VVNLGVYRHKTRNVNMMKRGFLGLSLVLALMLVFTAMADAAQPVSATGDFVLSLNPDDIELQPHGANCLLQVEALVTFSGDLMGEATAHTAALIFATCDDVAGSLPGSIRDVFWSTMHFTGNLNGSPVTAGIHYHGRAEECGQISAVMNFSGDLRGVVQVDGQAGVDGSYSGTLVRK
jgi:hypothetical protein